MAKKNRKPIYLFVLALILLYVVIYVIPRVTGALEQTEILEPGTIQITEEATCYFVREEAVYEAETAGTLDYVVDEGIHVRSGTKIMKLTGTDSGDQQETKTNSKYDNLIEKLGKKVIFTTDCKAESSGVVSYYIDGYEGRFTPESMLKMKYEDVKRLKIEAVDTIRKSTLKKEPLFKICDNDNWYLMFWVEAGSVANYEVGQAISVQLPEGDVEGDVLQVKADEDQWQIIVQTNRYYKEFAKSRIADADVVSKEYDGLIVSNGSLTTKASKPGLMVKQKDGTYAFTEVKVIASNGEHSVLKDSLFTDAEGNTVKTVKVYDEVLKHPGDVQK